MSGNKLFTTVSMKQPSSSKFDLSHDVKMSMKFGRLYPCLVMDVLPGDKFFIAADALLRFAPLLSPVMHRLDMYIHYFFVPNRLLWSNWEDFISGIPDTNGDAYVPPYITLDDVGLSPDFLALADYMGLPTIPTGATATNVSAFPFAAYNLIYNEYFRDQNQCQEQDYELTDGSNSPGSFLIQYRAWEHDYFTSALPFAQKGAAVSIPLGEVELVDDWETVVESNPVFMSNVTTFPDGQPINHNSDKLTVGAATEPVAYDPKGSLQVGATTINDLRRAYRLQEWLEKNARGGTRYTEQIRAHFGVKSPDSRLQRPEYIVGVKSPVVISEVLNQTGPSEYFNSETNEPVQTGGAQGDMAGHGVSVATGRMGTYYAQEHGWIIGLVSVMPKTAYQQGIPRMWTRNEFMDYAFPSFANLGEQEVLGKEIMAFTAENDELWGYIPRYAEYKFMSSRVSGDFRTTLNYWHCGRVFDAFPELSDTFIECRADYIADRIFAAGSTADYLWSHILHKIHAVRKLPFYGTPSI